MSTWSKNLKLYLDGSLNWFVGVKLDIQRKMKYAGYISQLNEISGEKIPEKIRKLKEDLTPNSPNSSVSKLATEYKNLAEDLIKHSEKVANESKKSWNKKSIIGYVTSYFDTGIKKRFTDYFNTGLKIYKDDGGSYEKVGYYINTQGVLKYSDGKSKEPQVIFKINNFNSRKSPFSSLFKSRFLGEAFGRPSMKLTSKLFLDLIKQAPDNAKFFVRSEGFDKVEFPVSKSFIDLFEQCEKYHEIRELQKGHDELDDEETFLRELTEEIIHKADTYISQNESQGTNVEKVEIMQAIKDYFDIENNIYYGNKDLLASRVKNDSWFNWFKKPFTRMDEADRALSIVKDILKSNNYDFFEKAMDKKLEAVEEEKRIEQEKIRVEAEEKRIEQEKIRVKAEEKLKLQKANVVIDKRQELKQHLDTLYNLDQEKFKTFDDYANQTSLILQKFTVSKNSCKKAYEDLIKILEGVNNLDNFPEILFPDEFNIDGFPIEKNITVIDYLKNFLNRGLQVIEIDIEKNFNHKYAFAINQVFMALSYHYKDKQRRENITEQQAENYDELLKKLSNVLVDVHEPEDIPTVNISVDKFKQEIDRMQLEYNELTVKVNKIIEKFKAAKLYNISNPLINYLESKLGLFKQALVEIHTKLEPLAERDFNALQCQEKYQFDIKEWIIDLSLFQSEFTSEITTIISKDVVFQDVSTNDSNYIQQVVQDEEQDPNDEKKDQNKEIKIFDKIIHSSWKVKSSSENANEDFTYRKLNPKKRLPSYTEQEFKRDINSALKSIDTMKERCEFNIGNTIASHKNLPSGQNAVDALKESLGLASGPSKDMSLENNSYVPSQNVHSMFRKRSSSTSIPPEQGNENSKTKPNQF